MHQPHLQRRELLSVIGLLLVTSLACSLGGDAAAPQGTPIVIVVTQLVPAPQGTPPSVVNQPTQQPIVGQPTITSAPPTVEPTATPNPGNGPGGCILNAAFVADLTVPDNTVLAPNAPFVKSWRVKNTGTCNWDAGYQLVFAEGNQMSGPVGVPINVTAPGGTLDVSVNLTAPAAPSATPVVGKWTLKASNNVIFGGKYTVIIVVPLPPTTEPTVTPTIAPSLPDWPLVRQGDTGSVVTALQYLLKFQGQTPTADGIFGPGTRTAVVNFQTLKALSADGVVGPNTWSALVKGVLIQQNSTGDAVRAAQTLLRNKFNYTAVAVDGIFGPKSDAAVRDFQTSHGLGVDGIIGPKTWQALVSY